MSGPYVAAAGMTADELATLQRIVAREAARRVALPAADSAAVAVRYFLDLAGRRRERFVALYLDARNVPIGKPYVVSIGTASASLVHPREVYREAIRRGALALIVAHNHPSGNSEPSADDVALTKRLAECGTLLGIELLDHLVVARGGYHSWAAAGRPAGVGAPWSFSMLPGVER